MFKYKNWNVFLKLGFNNDRETPQAEEIRPSIRSKQKRGIRIYCQTRIFKVHFKVWDNFLAIESLLKMMKNAFYFTVKALFVLKIFKCLSWLFGHLGKRLD